MDRKYQVTFLSLATVTAMILLPFAIVKRPLKDWIIVYLVSVIGNSFADRFLVSKGYLKYKIRPFNNKFMIHVPFDYLQYPLMLLYYNQWTLNSRPSGIFLKLFPFIIPQVLIEMLAEKKTDLITWKKGWTWYHSFLSLMTKMLVCRLVIAVIRKMNTKELSIT
ncbi:hypothetical protein WQ57_12255 [Mesobacillus campisalis]|uniref:Uncharacterized protein n=1 Tax=Mesobacillus campisalis TaxID=1408103 RepID=A0A0M2SXL5_9BACI|nr:CBO0543 family protein [Mesobacillus campisalis]KKK37727.1 hypothetical protein WQ57_12255 [Mesobacillus campisalis]